MGKVYRRPDSPHYWIVYHVNGRRFREKAGRRKDGAEALLAKRELEVFEGRHFPEKREAGHTVSDLQRVWLDHAAKKRSLADDRQRFLRLVEMLGARTQIAAVQPADVMALRKKLAAIPLKTATVNRHLALLRSAFKVAAANGWQHRDPMKSVKLEKERNERDRICTPEEHALLLEAAQPKLRLAITLAYWTAMRQNEIVSLRWEWISLRSAIVKLPSSVTKTAEGRRVPLTREVVTALSAWPRSLDGRVFDVTPGTIASQFSALTRRLKIADLRFHDYRHTRLTLMRRAGVDIFTMQKISGHKTLEMLKRYQTVTDEDLRAAVERTAK